MPTLTQKCDVCKKALLKTDETHEHHPHYVSLGGKGTPTQTLHRACHLVLHSDDRKVWGSVGGKLTAATKVWATTLLNVRDDPAHETNRQFYRLFCSH